ATATGSDRGGIAKFGLPVSDDLVLCIGDGCGGCECGSGKWGAGPTAVVLKQDGPWTYGFLGNHIWSFAGQSDREDVSSTFL
ncbi:hypothetical protein ACC848_43045, partial [Rhizobium johnstonii]